jgi:hypothetical protein
VKLSSIFVAVFFFLLQIPKRGAISGCSGAEKWLPGLHQAMETCSASNWLLENLGRCREPF